MRLKGGYYSCPLYRCRKVSMDKLNFYTVDYDYVKYLQKSENKIRGFSRVPNMEYAKVYKQKFLCGVVLQVNDIDYYVPVTSYKQQKPDNFLITADNGQIVSSLRFNYMFPVPKELTSVHVISAEPDRAYRTLLAQELRCCIKNQAIIQKLAERTYKRVLLGKDAGLVVNSCDFRLLEQKYRRYKTQKHEGISIRHMQASDINDCVEDFILSFNSPPWNENWSKERAAEYVNDVFNSPKFVGFIMNNNDENIAYALCFRRYWWNEDDQYKLCMELFFTKPEYQEKGHGTTLFEHVEKYAKDNGLKSIMLYTKKDKPAFYFYEKNGFATISNLPNMFKNICT